MPRSLRPCLSFAGFILLLAALAGCSSGGSDTSTPAGPTGSSAQATGAASPSPAASASGTATAASPAAAGSAPTPPPEFAEMYRSLNANLDAWERALSTATPAAGSPVFGAHLLTANANRGTDLLTPATLQAVEAEITRFQQLGIQGITVTISFPVLNSDFPRSSEYLDFYAAVAQKVRAHRMTFTVEQHVIFGGTAFTTLTYDYSKLSFDRFTGLFHDMTQKIVDRLHPDYVTLLSEPDTFGKLTGYRNAGSPDGAAAFIGKVLTGINRGSTKLGAGAGAWLANAADYDRAFAALPLDYLDLHIYPVDAGVIASLGRIADVSKSTGKPIVLDEAWLLKVGANETTGAGFDQPTEEFRRDSYSFWQPLDARFLGLVAQFARQNGVVYVAPFWTTLFFAYSDYGPDTKGLAYKDLSQLTNRTATAAIRDGTYSPTGKAYQETIAGTTPAH